MTGHLEMLVDGRFVAGPGPEIEVVNPATEEVAARVASADVAMLDAAVAAARRAFDEGPWCTAPPRERSAAIHRLADAFDGGGGFRPDAPMGGFGISGLGRELGRWGIAEFLEPQHVQWRDDT